MRNNEIALFIDNVEYWQCTKDNEGWWAYVYNPLNFRCEGVAGPFQQAWLAQAVAKGMSWRFTHTGNVMGGLR